MRTYSTKEAASIAKVHYMTLYRWVSSGKIRASQSIRMKSHVMWRWTDSDVAKVRKLKGSQKPGPKPKKRK